MRIVEQNRLALHATALLLFMCGLQKGSLQQVHLLVYMELVYAQPGQSPWGQASAVVSAWDAYTQPLDRTMIKAAELEIKMNFHAGMPLVYI